jgi:hypothetical protein
VVLVVFRASNATDARGAKITSSPVRGLLREEVMDLELLSLIVKHLRDSGLNRTADTLLSEKPDVPVLPKKVRSLAYIHNEFQTLHKEKLRQRTAVKNLRNLLPAGTGDDPFKKGETIGRAKSSI